MNRTVGMQTSSVYYFMSESIEKRLYVGHVAYVIGVKVL